MVTAGLNSQVSSEKAWRTAYVTKPSGQFIPVLYASPQRGETHLMGVGGDWPKEADKGFTLAGHDIVEGTMDALGQDQLSYPIMC